MKHKTPHLTLLTKEARIEATRYLSRRDPVLRQVIKKYGPMAFVPQERHSPFQVWPKRLPISSSTESRQDNPGAVYQALSWPQIPKPEDLGKVKDTQIRAAGFSGARSLHCEIWPKKIIEGVVLTGRELLHLSDDEIVERLTQVRGIGRLDS